MRVLISFSIAFSLIFLVSAVETDVLAVQAAFTDAAIPTDLEITFEPIILLDVVYPNVIITTQGQTLQAQQVATAPSYQISKSNISTDTPYVVIMLDPDAPTPTLPLFRSFKHFVGGNFYARTTDVDGVFALVPSSPALYEYVVPHPASLAAHRYTWLLYDQPSDFDELASSAPAADSGFNVAVFAQAAGLGDPIGGSFAKIAL